METIATSIIIQRPVEEVFAFVTDARNNPLWQAGSGLRETQQLPDGPVGVGTRINEVWNFMGRSTHSTSEVTEFEVNRKYVRSAVGGSGPITRGEYTFEPVAGGTRWSQATTIQAGGLFPIAEPLLAATLKQGFDTNMAAAKALLERPVAKNTR